MGRAKKPGMDLEFDMEDGYYALGFAKGMTEGISSKYYLTSVVEYAWAAMAEDFNEQMMLSAMNDVNALHHVYEPGMLGVRGAELWENRLYGTGEKRQASFEWKTSKVPILKPEERARDASDPMSEVDDEIIDKLSKEDYIFRLRAPIMEYGMRTTITPRPGKKRLFIPTFGVNYPYSRGGKKKGHRTLGTAENFRFEAINIPDFSFSNPQEPSGSQGTVGQFTAQWIAFWAGGGADATWKTKVRSAVEGGLDEWESTLGKKVKGTRTRKHTAKIHTFKDQHAAFENGRNMAQAFIKGKARSHAAAYRYAEKHGGFGGDIVH